MSGEDAVRVTRVELKRVRASELIRADERLSSCAFVGAVPESEREAFFDEGIARKFSSDAPLFSNGDQAALLFLVLKGEVRLLTGPGGTAEFGRVQVGELVGEAELLTRAAQRSHSALACGDVHVLELAFDRVIELAGKTPAVAKLLSLEAARRRKEQSEMSDFLGRW